MFVRFLNLDGVLSTYALSLWFSLEIQSILRYARQVHEDFAGLRKRVKIRISHKQRDYRHIPIDLE